MGTKAAKPRKAMHVSEARTLGEFPNVGPATVGDFRVLGITKPAQLRGKDPMKLYQSLCRKTGTAHDPCVIDVFMAAVEFAEGGPAKPWWDYTLARKAMVGKPAGGRKKAKEGKR